VALHYATKEQLEAWRGICSAGKIAEGRLRGLLYEYGVEKLRIAEADQMSFGRGKFWAVTGAVSSAAEGTILLNLERVRRRDEWYGRTYTYHTKPRETNGRLEYRGIRVKCAGREWVFAGGKVELRADATCEEEAMTSRREAAKARNSRGSVQGTPKPPASAARSSRASRSNGYDAAADAAKRFPPTPNVQPRKEVKQQRMFTRGKPVGGSAYRDGMFCVGFEKATLKAIGDGSKEATMRFAIVLDKEVAAKLPAPVATSFAEIRRTDASMQFIELDAGAIAAQNFEFYAWPEKAPPDFEAKATQPEKVEFEKDKESGSVLLRFSIRVPLLRDSGIWILTNFGNQLWMKLEAAQRELAMAARA
jgi:hypothetical protein